MAEHCSWFAADSLVREFEIKPADRSVEIWAGMAVVEIEVGGESHRLQRQRLALRIHIGGSDIVACWATPGHPAVRGAQPLKEIVGCPVFLKMTITCLMGGAVLGVGDSCEQAGGEKQYNPESGFHNTAPSRTSGGCPGEECFSLKNLVNS